MKAKYPERPFVIGVGVACIIALLGAMAITVSATLQLMLLGIELCVIIALAWYMTATV